MNRNTSSIYYQQNEEEVKSADGVNNLSLSYTKASYLKRITEDRTGRSIHFNTGVRDSREWKDIYPYPEPDAFQEKYQTKYLDNIEVKQDNQLVKVFQFVYESIEAGVIGENKFKRFLTKVIHKDAKGNLLPSHDFEYIGVNDDTNCQTIDCSSKNRGALCSITFPTGGSTSFDYEFVNTGIEFKQGETIDEMNLSLNYRKIPLVMNNEHLIVQHWNGVYLVLNGWHWDGSEWVFQEELQTSLSFLHAFDCQGDVSFPTHPIIRLADDKLIVLEPGKVKGNDLLNSPFESGKLWGWHWSGSNWISNGLIDSTSIYFRAGPCFTTFLPKISITKNKMVLFNPYQGVSPDFESEIRAYHWDGQNWIKDGTLDQFSQYRHELQDPKLSIVGDHIILMHLVIGSSGTLKTWNWNSESNAWDGPVVLNNGAPYWYATSIKPVLSVTDKHLFVIDPVSNKCVHPGRLPLQKPLESAKIYAWNWDGNSWVADINSNLDNMTLYWNQEFTNGGSRQFPPTIRLVNDKLAIFTRGDIMGQDPLYVRQWDGNQWQSADWNGDGVLDYRNFYYAFTGASLHELILTDEMIALIDSRDHTVSAGGTLQTWRWDWANGKWGDVNEIADIDFALSNSEPGNPLKYMSVVDNQRIVVVDGSGNSGDELDYFDNVRSWHWDEKNKTWGLSDFNWDENFEGEAPAVHLSNDKIAMGRNMLKTWIVYEDQWINLPPQDFRCVHKTTVDGLDNLSTVNFHYEKGLFDTNSESAKYNKVSSVLPDNSYCETFTYNDLADGLEWNDVDGDENENEKHYKELDGIPYRIKTYDSSLNPISETVYTWSLQSVSVDETLSYTDGTAYYNQLKKKESEKDNINKTESYTYNDNNGLPESVTENNSDNSVRINKTAYAFEQSAYTTMEDANMLSQVAQQTIYEGTDDPANARSSAVTTYKDWGDGKWDAVKSYQWQENDPIPSLPDFTTWTSGTPDAEWMQISKIIDRDEYGNILEIMDAKGVPTAIKWGYDHSLPVAMISNANSRETYMDNFENNGNWDFATTNVSVVNTEMFSGKNTCQLTKEGSSYIFFRKRVEGLEVGKKYIFSVMAKGVGGFFNSRTLGTGASWADSRSNRTNSSNWKLYTWERVPNTISMDIYFEVDGGTVDNRIYCDDFRFYPADAMCVSQSYDPNTLQVIDQTDANDKTIHYSYDNFGRLGNITNHDHHSLAGYDYYYSRPNNSDEYNPDEPNYISSSSLPAWKETSDFSSSVGWYYAHDVNFNISMAGETTVRMGTLPGYGGGWSAISKNVSNDNVIAKLDFYPDNTTGESPHPLYFEGTDNRFAIKYKPAEDKFEIQTKIKGVGWNYPFEFELDAPHNQWYTLEIESHANGTCMGWVYPKDGNRNYKDMCIQRGYPSNWVSYVRSASNDDYYYIANYYFGIITEAIQYVDGLGRSIQTQQINGTSDIVSAVDYDALGRAYKQWKPYPANTSHKYTDKYDEYDGARAYYDGSPGANCNGFPYNEVEYRNGFSNEPLEIGQPGSSYKLGANTMNYTYSSNSYSIYGYEPSTLYKTIANDENDRDTEIYTDKFGNTVGQIAADGTTTTGFKYNIMGNLTEVYPPNYFAPPTGSQNDWITSYNYNTLGQMTEKNTPDAETTRYKYDKNGNLRFVQDAVHYNGGDDLVFYQYDALNRNTVIGEATSDATIPNWSSLDPDHKYDSGTENFENSNNYHIHNFYDNAATDCPGSQTQQNLKGRLSKVEYRDKKSGGWGKTYYSYDDDGNMEWIIQNILDGEIGEKKIEYDYDLQGKATKVSYNALQTDQYFFWYKYNQLGQLEKVYSSKNNTKPALTDAYYTYTPSGQVDKMKLSETSAGVYAETMDYAYTPRDWLDNINEPVAGKNFSETINDYGINEFANNFALKLHYGNPENGTPQYNGNISQAEYFTKRNGGTHNNNAVDSYAHRYNFGYDALSRLKSAVFYYTGSQYDYVSGGEKYKLNIGAYDPMGNIQTLTRKNETGSGPVFNYNYINRTNKLNYVGNLGGQSSGNYNYDANGNMTGDVSKGIGAGAIKYDYRNLPYEISGAGNHKIHYGYDHTGNRVYKEKFEGGADPVSAQYYVNDAGGKTIAVYDKDGNLLFINLYGLDVIGKYTE